MYISIYIHIERYSINIHIVHPDSNLGFLLGGKKCRARGRSWSGSGADGILCLMETNVEKCVSSIEQHEAFKGGSGWVVLIEGRKGSNPYGHLLQQRSKCFCFRCPVIGVPVCLPASSCLKQGVLTLDRIYQVAWWNTHFGTWLFMFESTLQLHVSIIQVYVTTIQVPRALKAFARTQMLQPQESCKVRQIDESMLLLNIIVRYV